MPFVEIAGFRVHYRDTGEGLPIVLLHGWGMSGATWSEVIEHLAPDYRCLALDWPGYGASEHMPDPTIQKYTWLVDAFCRALDLDQVMLMGHSMGGQISLLTAINHPQRVARVVTLGAVITGEVYVSRSMRWIGLAGLRIMAIPAIGAPLMRLVNRFTPLVRRMVGGIWYGAKECMDTVYFERDFALWMRQDTIITRLHNWPSMTGTNLLPRLAEVEAPVLLVHGAADHTVHVEQAYKAADVLPGAQLLVMPRAGHFPAHEQPARFYPALREWFRSAEGAEHGMRDLISRRS